MTDLVKRLKDRGQSLKEDHIAYILYHTVQVTSEAENSVISRTILCPGNIRGTHQMAISGVDIRYQLGSEHGD